MSKETKPHAFVTYLESLAEDRAALAALRRGLGRPPGTAPDMYPYVIPHLPVGTGRRYEDACYLVAALFGLHPLSASGGNMGHHFNRTLDRANPDHNVATERRFTVLLATHVDDLPDHLRQAVSFLKSRDQPVPVNYHQLLRDVLGWKHQARYVQRNWANAFWGRPAPEEQESS